MVYELYGRTGGREKDYGGESIFSEGAFEGSPAELRQGDKLKNIFLV